MRFDQCTNGNIFMHGWTKEQAVMSDHDKAILQELAKKMAAYAARPEEEAAGMNSCRWNLPASAKAKWRRNGRCGCTRN